jgi:hypothetical protein
MTNLAERRRTDRVKVMLSATVEQGGELAPTRLANVSQDGALLVGPALRDGTSVMLQRNVTDVRGSVTWADGNRCGLKFEQNLDVAATLRTISRPKHKQAVRKRRPGLKCSPMTHAEKAVFDRWLNTGPQLLGD